MSHSATTDGVPKLHISTRYPYTHGVPVQTPDWLSSDHVKRYRYGQEPYYQEAMDVFKRLPEASEWLRQHTFLLVKPDAFPPRKFADICMCVEGDQFAVVKTIPLRLNRYSIRELWRYEYNVATVERYTLLDRLLSAGDSVILMLRSIVSERTSASERLTALKGPSDPKLRPRDCLRSRVGALSGTLNFVHTPDTPIDVVRELGVMLERSVLAQVLIECSDYSVTQSPDETLTIGKRVSDTYPLHPLNLPEIVRDLGQTFATALDRAGPFLETSTFSELDKLSAHFSLSTWDQIVIANRFLRFSVPGIKKSLEFEMSTTQS